VKRTVAMVAGVVSLGLALYVGSRLTAQTGGATPPSMKMRVVNLQYVIKNFSRTETLRKEHTELFQKYDKEINDLKTAIEARTKQMQDPKNAEFRAALEKEIKRLQREMQDKTDEARAKLDQKQGDIIVLVYKEVEDAVKEYARSGGLELVLHYNDAVDEKDRSSAANIARKMSAGACMPMFYATGLDISQDIVNALNGKYPASTTTTPAPGGGGM
jgi:Skp family chaperone for outer membrane proteins